MSDGLSGADLHLHTVYSDGIYTPEAVVRAALGRSLRAIAITDHDSVSGVAPTREAAAGSGLEVVAGIELAVQHEGTELHLVGLFVDRRETALRRHLVELRARRRARVIETIRRLGRVGVHIDTNEVFAAAEPGLPGRVHLAQVLATHRKVSSYQDAFQKYLGNGRPAYVKRSWPSLEEAVEIIHEAGGLAVYAHPLLTSRDGAIPLLVSAGIDGVEVYQPNHPAADRQRYAEICSRHGLLPSGGSDCHGTGPNGGMIGTARLPDEEFDLLVGAVPCRGSMATPWLEPTK